jgi:hypothetical protein
MSEIRSQKFDRMNSVHLAAQIRSLAAGRSSCFLEAA